MDPVEAAQMHVQYAVQSQPQAKCTYSLWLPAAHDTAVVPVVALLLLLSLLLLLQLLHATC